MKAEIHPDYHEITVVQTNGESFKVRTTWGKPGEEMRLDIDPLNHPAWQGGAQKVIEKGQLTKFEKRFGNFMSGGVSGAKSGEESKEGKGGKK